MTAIPHDVLDTNYSDDLVEATCCVDDFAEVLQALLDEDETCPKTVEDLLKMASVGIVDETDGVYTFDDTNSYRAFLHYYCPERVMLYLRDMYCRVYSEDNGNNDAVFRLGPLLRMVQFRLSGGIADAWSEILRFDHVNVEKSRSAYETGCRVCPLDPEYKAAERRFRAHYDVTHLPKLFRSR